MRAGAILLMGLGCLSLFTGCANVKPWERGTLGDYTMRADRHPLADSQRDHVFFSREEANGGQSVGGGGCGCN